MPRAKIPEDKRKQQQTVKLEREFLALARILADERGWSLLQTLSSATRLGLIALQDGQAPASLDEIRSA